MHLLMALGYAATGGSFNLSSQLRPARERRPGQRARVPAIRPRLRFSATVSARAPCSSAILSNSPAVKSPRLSGRIVTVLGLALARSVREIEGDEGRVVFLEVAQGMAEDLSMS